MTSSSAEEITIEHLPEGVITRLGPVGSQCWCGGDMVLSTFYPHRGALTKGGEVERVCNFCGRIKGRYTVKKTPRW